MKYLIMTEGTSELALINCMIDQDIFLIDKKDMLDEQVFHKRQLDGYIYTLMRALPKDEKITIMRIGDTLRDNLKIDELYLTRIKREIKICTKPEFEKLMIIHENLVEAFRKTKLKPSTFIKNIKKDYHKSYVYIYNYFKDQDIKQILCEYKRIKKHTRDEYYLCDFTK